MGKTIVSRAVIAAMALCVRGITHAANASDDAVVLEKEWGTVEHCLGIIRGCQTKDGMIRMKGDGAAVWCVPYFGNLAALALLAAHDIHPNASDLARVEQWLTWYARHQESDGTIFDREGTLSAYASNNRRDSADSYAATFLMAAWRYAEEVKQSPSAEIVEAVQKAFAALGAVTQADGLTIAKPDYPVKYLMDNIEVYQGLVDGAAFFDSLGLKEDAQKARLMAARLAGSLAKFGSDGDTPYAYAMALDGSVSGGLSTPYPHGLAQLFALAYLKPKRPELWTELNRRFKPGDPGLPVERWLTAARRQAGPEERERLRRDTLADARRFTGGNVYVDRPAMVVLALIDGAARFPDVP